jgi:ankyrin repeat protein
MVLDADLSDPTSFRPPGVRQIIKPMISGKERSIFHLHSKTKVKKSIGNQSIPEFVDPCQNVQTRPMKLTAETHRRTKTRETSTDRSGTLTSKSEVTISTGNISVASSDGEGARTRRINANFTNAAKKGDAMLILRYIRENDTKSQLDQESIDVALIELSRRSESSERELKAVSALLDNCRPNLEYRRPRNGRTSLMWAAWFGHERIIEVLLSQGASRVAVDESFKRTALSWAAKQNNRLRVVKLLLDNIPNDERQMVNSTDVNDKSALALACIDQTQIPTATALLNCGADPNVEVAGESLLMRAIIWGDETFIRLLVEKGADIQIKDADAVPLLLVVIENRSSELVQYLIRSGADIEIKDTRGRSPLMQAILHRKYDIIVLLLQNGAKRNIPDSIGRTAEDWGRWVQNKKILNILFPQS